MLSAQWPGMNAATVAIGPLRSPSRPADHEEEQNRNDNGRGNHPAPEARVASQVRRAAQPVEDATAQVTEHGSVLAEIARWGLVVRNSGCGGHPTPTGDQHAEDPAAGR